MPASLYWIIAALPCLIALALWWMVAKHLPHTTGRADTPLGRQDATRFGIYLAVWLLLAIALGATGVLAPGVVFDFPLLPLGIALPLISGLWLLRRSERLNRIIQAVPIHWLVGIQFYRVIGASFLILFSIGLMPREFAMPAGVGDVLVGLFAPLVGYLYYKGYRGSCMAVVAWNLLGIADLIAAVSIGFATAPGPFHMLDTDPVNALVVTYPIVVIPLFAVPLSILLHLAALKRLAQDLGHLCNNRSCCQAHRAQA